MEVLLPPTFDNRLVIPDMNMLPINVNWLPIQVKLADKICQNNCTTRDCYYLTRDEHLRTIAPSHPCNSAMHYSSDAPKAAIYSTIPTEMTIDYIKTGYSNSDEQFNDTTRLVTISIIKEPLNRLPNSDYCIVQNNEQYSKFMLEEYPNMIEEMAKFLNDLVVEHNNEYRYKIIRRKVFLIRAFGNSKVTSRKFKELLSVDCGVLYNSITALFKELNISIYRCDIFERPKLMNLFHTKLVKPIPNRDEDLIKKVLAVMNVTKGN